MTGTCGVLPREDRLDRCERTERRLDLVEDGPRVDLPGGEPWKPPVLMERVCFRLDSILFSFSPVPCRAILMTVRVADQGREAYDVKN